MCSCEQCTSLLQLSKQNQDSTLCNMEERQKYLVDVQIFVCVFNILHIYYFWQWHFLKGALAEVCAPVYKCKLPCLARSTNTAHIKKTEITKANTILLWKKHKLNFPKHYTTLSLICQKQGCWRHVPNCSSVIY